eukprot:CAMPEP_0182454236 /NCGR_PEP_ID=MMETSP1319-20130603/962_1 /TAXON_ID=172717 /ORGANISM="Bolidomonas pacifica, Strain RCC208" /LENGTH=284 /DNA_ID=CAMNT_0024652235 /DNA_START=213 /DNA_END=1063 /DNA_ORIENTATION=+
MSLTLNPDKQIGFTLSHSEEATKSILTLTNTTDQHFAFKVKTTQPRRYLVRPNQGLVKPDETEEVTIILVDKDKQMLLTDFSQIGTSALSSSKDKFLIQSCKVEANFYNTTKSKPPKEMAEALTAMWQRVTQDKTAVSNTKLQVKHTVSPSADSNSQPGANNDKSAAGYGSVMQGADALRSSTSPPSSSPDPEGNFKSDATLRKKYDELVAFSVNLTAERDILNNALEQAKRDLNREMAARMSAEDSAVMGPASRAGKRGEKGAGEAVGERKRGGFSLFVLLVV